MIHPRRRLHHLMMMVILYHPRRLGHVRDLVDERGKLISSSTNDPRKGNIVIIGAGTGNQMIIRTTHRIQHRLARTELEEERKGGKNDDIVSTEMIVKAMQWIILPKTKGMESMVKMNPR